MSTERMIMAYEPGTILLVEFPYTDRTAAKQRPVLVVSSARFNSGADVVVVPLSSRIVAGDSFGFPIESTEPYFPHTRLRASSTVKWTKPLVISSVFVVKQLGMIPPDVLRKIRDLIKSLFS
jgi:mRNA interferase MazF